MQGTRALVSSASSTGSSETSTTCCTRLRQRPDGQSLLPTVWVGSGCCTNSPRARGSDNRHLLPAALEDGVQDPRAGKAGVWKGPSLGVRLWGARELSFLFIQGRQSLTDRGPTPTDFRRDPVSKRSHTAGQDFDIRICGGHTHAIHDPSRCLVTPEV